MLKNVLIITLLLTTLILGTRNASNTNVEMSTTTYSKVFNTMYDECHELGDEKACEAVYELEDLYGAL